MSDFLNGSCLTTSGLTIDDFMIVETIGKCRKIADKFGYILIIR